MKASNSIIKNLSFNSIFSALKEVVVGILYHVTQFTKRIITNMVSKKITVKTTVQILNQSVCLILRLSTGQKRQKIGLQLKQILLGKLCCSIQANVCSVLRLFQSRMF